MSELSASELFNIISQSVSQWKKKLALQSSQAKRTRQDCTNESIFWKMHMLVIAATSLKFKSAFLHV